jgi:single-strand DNA-binding protein
MASINKVILAGRIGRQPEIKHVGDKKVCNFSLATSESYKDKNGNKVEQTEWHNVEVWGQTAKFVADYIKKGYLVYVEGQIKTDKYQKEGIDVYATKIRAEVVKNLTPKQEESQDEKPPRQEYK